MKQLKHLLLLACCCIAAASHAQETAITDTNEVAACTDGCCCGTTGQTPLGVMTGHIHTKGQWMASYTYMDMMMKGNRSGTQKEATDVVNKYYVMAPDRMSMQMHMAMLMYGISDRLTVMAMGGYSVNNMSMAMAQFATMNMPGMQMTAMSTSMASKSSGFADTKLYGLYNLSHSSRRHIIATLGISIPTGSIAAMGPSVSGSDHRLPYNMQLGSGTYAIMPGATYITTQDHFSWGAQAGANVNVGTNRLGYRLGNSYNATSWAAYQLFPFVSVSVRGEWTETGNIKGFDARIAEFMYNDPSADSRNYGGQRASGYAGLNFSIARIKALHLLCEYGMPVYENLHGLQMSAHASITAGVQYAF